MTTKPQPDDVVPRQDIRGNRLAAATRKSLLWTFGGQWLNFGLQMVASLIFFRLLGKEAVGIVAMALVVTAIADQFRSVGLSQAVIQRDDLTYRQLNSLFWANGAVGFLLAAIVASLAGLVDAANRNPQPDLKPIIYAFAASYIVTGFGVQANALMARQLRFKELSLRDTAARILSVITAFAAYAAGADYWSLVIMHISMQIYATILVWLAITWRPSAPGGFRNSTHLLKFGAGIQIGDLFNVLSRQVDNFLVGAAFGPAALGVYKQSYSTVMMPIRQMKAPVGAAMQPLMASTRHEPERYSGLYLSTIRGLAHVGVPLLCGLVVFTEPIVELLLGRGAMEAVPVFRWLAIAAVTQLVASTAGWLLTTTEQARRYAHMSIATSLATIVSFVAGLPFGMTGVAASYAVGQVIIAIPLFFYCAKGTPVAARDIFAAFVRPLTIGGLIIAVLLVLRQLVANWHYGASVPLAVVVTLVTWAVILRCWPAALRDVSGMLSVVRKKKTVSNAS